MTLNERDRVDVNRYLAMQDVEFWASIDRWLRPKDKNDAMDDALNAMRALFRPHRWLPYIDIMTPRTRHYLLHIRAKLCHDSRWQHLLRELAGTAPADAAMSIAQRFIDTRPVLGSYRMSFVALAVGIVRIGIAHFTCG
ncbi:MAG: hypothetical protein IPK19_18135 [Chloroflexi bacterium]|nr:hypothetical protein [Chloroflexota bacterium]